MKFTRNRTIGVIIAGIAGGVVFASVATAGTPALTPAQQLAAAAAHPASVGKDAKGNYHDCVNQSSPYQEMRGNAQDNCWAGWLPRDLAPAPSYGVALVNIARGSAAATTWGSFTTTLGSPAPMGDQASGVLRMSCSAAQAPCSISVKAYATKTGEHIYPRLDITKQNFDTGAPLGNCEYADGVNNDGGSLALTAVSLGTPTGQTVPLGVGGSLDCGSDQVLPASGVVNVIQVPVGRYDIAATFFFKK